MDKTKLYLQQAKDVEAETFEQEKILLSRKTLRVVSLNEVAAILWDAMATPIRSDDLLDMMVEAFPSGSPNELEAELGQLITQLSQEELIQHNPPG